MRYLLILFTNFMFLNSFSTGGYRTEYYYQFTICNSLGQVLKNQECKIIIDDKPYNLRTDSIGIVNFYLGGTENCASGRNLFARVFNSSDWSWLPKLIFIECKGLTFDIKKNWKKYFRRRNKKPEFYNYETGELKNKLK